MRDQYAVFEYRQQLFCDVSKSRGILEHLWSNAGQSLYAGWYRCFGVNELLLPVYALAIFDDHVAQLEYTVVGRLAAGGFTIEYHHLRWEAI